MIRGDLTPECTAAIRAVPEALGKKAGPEDDRTEGRRFHDALQLACAFQACSWVIPRRLRISASRQPRASSSRIAARHGSNPGRILMSLRPDEAAGVPSCSRSATP